MTFKDFLKVYRGEFELVAGDEEVSCTIVWDEYRLTAAGEALFDTLLNSEVKIQKFGTRYGDTETVITSEASFAAGEKFARYQAGFCSCELYDKIFREDD